MQLAFIVGVASLCVPSYAHVTVAIPAARNVISSYPGSPQNYCPHCQNAGGTGYVSEGTRKWPAGRHGVCGDPADKPQDHLVGGKYWNKLRNAVGGSYAPGASFQVTVQWFTYHRGSMEFRICVISPVTEEAEESQLTQECFDTAAPLIQAKNGRMPGAKWWYFNPQRKEGAMYNATTWLQLPKDLTCDGVTAKCVMQAHYVTGNTCTRPGVPSSLAVQGLPYCNEAGAGYPEEFWQCIDVHILTDAQPSAPAKLPQPPPPDASALPPSLPHTIPPPLAPPLPPQLPEDASLVPRPSAATPEAVPAPQNPSAPVPLEPEGCMDDQRQECFCYGKLPNKMGGFYANRWDNTNQSYLGCQHDGGVRMYWCPSRQVYNAEVGGCVVNSNPNAPGLLGWGCYPGQRFALRINRGGDAQCWSADMMACTQVCKLAKGDNPQPYRPPYTGAISCGLMMEMMKGYTGYEQPRHFCSKACQALGCPKGPNSWRCVPGVTQVLRLTDDGTTPQCLLRPAGSSAAVRASAQGTAEDNAGCARCPTNLTQTTKFIPLFAPLQSYTCDTAGSGDADYAPAFCSSQVCSALGCKQGERPPEP